MTVWAKIRGTTRYEVSNQGFVRSTRSGLILTPWFAGAGYPAVYLGRGNPRYVHELVCTAFHGPRPSPDHQVAHNDGNRKNNNSANLRWATRHENKADELLHGTRLQGEQQNGAKLSPTDIRRIRTLAADGVPQRSIAKTYEISQSNVSYIVQRKHWSHIE